MTVKDLKEGDVIITREKITGDQEFQNTRYGARIECVKVARKTLTAIGVVSMDYIKEDQSTFVNWYDITKFDSVFEVIELLDGVEG